MGRKVTAFLVVGFLLGSAPARETGEPRLLTAAMPAAASSTAGTDVSLLRGIDLPRRWTAAPSDEAQPDVSADARRLVYVSDENGSHDLFLFDLPPATPAPPRVLVSTPASERAPRFSPDGRKVVYVSTIDDAFGDIWIADVRSGKTRRLTDRASRDAAPAWMPDGKSVVFASSQGDGTPRLVVMNLETRKRAPLGPFAAATDPAISPDGKLLACVALSDDTQERRLALLQLATGKARYLTAGVSPVRGPRFTPDARAILCAVGADDTNGNGRAESRDNWTIWRIEWPHDIFDDDARVRKAAPTKRYPLTAANRDTRYVAPFADGFFVASAPAAREPGDIFSYDTQGVLRLPGDATPQALAPAIALLEQERPYEEDLLIAAWRQVGWRRFDQVSQSLNVRARLREIALLERLGRLDQASAQAVLLIDSLAVDDPRGTMAAVEWERIRLAQVERATAREDRLGEARMLALERLADLSHPATGGDTHRAASAEAALLRARIQRDMRDWDAALATLDRLVGSATAPDIAARALLLRGYILEELNLLPDARKTYRRVIREFEAHRRSAFVAARRLIRLAGAEGDADARRVLLGALISQPETPELVRAVAQNRVGDLYVEELRLPEALEAYAETATRYPEQIEAVAASHFARSRVLYDQARYGESVRMYERIERRLRPRDDAFYRRARRGFIRQTILKGEAEYRMGDPLLARATFDGLRAYDPALLESWRGILRSDHALGRIPESLVPIEEQLANMPSGDPPRTALRYARGLALSYLPDRQNDALDELHRAAVLDPASPYPHQTLGFLYEQRMIRKGDRSAASRALYEYQLAIALGDARRNPTNAAALLVNVGNVCRLLDLWSLASHYYTMRLTLAERGDPATAFEDIRTEYLFWRHAGEAAFKAGDSAAADAHYAKASELLSPIERKHPDTADWNAQRTELLDRRALARQEMGEYDQAVQLFDKVAKRAENPRAAALATRNRGVNLYLGARNRVGPDRTERLGRAWRAFETARDMVARHGVIDPDERRPKSRGLFNLAVVVGLGGGDASQAGQGFERKAEQRLIEGFMGHIAEVSGDPQRALESIEKQIAGLPDETDANRAYVRTERAVLCSRLAALFERLGRVEEALARTFASLDASTWGEGDERVVNPVGLATAAMNLARLWDAYPERVSPGLIAWKSKRDDREVEASANESAASRVLLEMLDAAREDAVAMSLQAAATLEPWLAFHRGMVLRRRAEAWGDEAAKPGDSVRFLTLAARAQAAWREACAAFIETDELIDATWGAFGASDRAALRRLAVSARLRASICARRLGRAEEALALEAAGLEAARAWGYDRLVFSCLFERGLLSANPEDRLGLWQNAADGLLDALPDPRPLPPAYRASLATVGADMARRAASDGDWESTWRWTEWAGARALRATLLRIAPDLDQAASARALFVRREEVMAQIKALRESETPPWEGKSVAEQSESLRAAWLDALAGAPLPYHVLAMLSGEPLDLVEIIDLPSADTAFLKVAWLGDALLTIVAIPGRGVDAKIAPADAAFRGVLQPLAVGVRAQWADAQRRALGAAVFGSESDRLNGVRDLVILPDAASMRLPIQDAQLSDGRRAGEKWATVWSPSSAAFYVSQTRLAPWRRRVAVAGQSRIPDGAGYLVQRLRPDADARDLLRAGREADAVRCDWPLRLSGSNAAESAFLAPGGSGQPGANLGISRLFAARWGLSCLQLGRVAMQGAPSPNERMDAFHVFALAAMWGGCPTVATGPTEPPSGADDDALWQTFWREMATVAPGEALRRARAAAPKSAQGYRIWGAPGMGIEEARAFFEENLDERNGAGRKAWDEKRPVEAAQAWGQMLALLETYEPEDPRVPRAMAMVLNAARKAGQPERGADVAGRLVEWRATHDAPSAELAEARVVWAVFLSETGRYDAGVEQVDLARALSQKDDDAAGMLRATVQRGLILENAGRFEDALAALRNARALCRRLEAPEEEAEQCLRISRLLWMRMSRYREAAEVARDALALYQSVENHEGRARALLDLADVSQRQGELVEALSIADRATSLGEALADPALMARGALKRAEVTWLTGDYRSALLNQREAQRLAHAADRASLAIASRQIAGLIYWMLNDHDRALDELDAALDMAQAAGDRSEMASARNNIGIVLRTRGEIEKALENFREALEIDTELRVPWGRAYDLRNIGIAERMAKRFDDATLHLREAAAISREIGDRVNLAKTMLALGDVLRETRNIQKARVAYLDALGIARRRVLREVEWRCLDGLARLALLENRREEAKAQLIQAIEVVESMRASIRVEQLQDGFLADKQSLYGRMIRLQLDEGRDAEAFEINERARGRAFIDLLGNRRIPMHSKQDRAYLAQEAELRGEISKLERALADSQSEEARRRGEQRLESRRRALRDLIVEIRAKRPDLAGFVSVDTVKAPDLLAMLDEGVALVEYFVGEEESVVWVARAGRIEAVRLPEKRADLEADVIRYRRRIQALEPVGDLSADLYKRLVAPVAERIADARVVGIVPHGVLHYLSFASLQGADGHLIDRHALFYLPSASAWRYTRSKRGAASGRRVLALGNPDLGDPAMDLPFARKEAERLRWPFPNVDIFTGDAASEARLRERAGEYGVVHIASHGEFDSAMPLFSALRLTPGQGYDGNLTVTEIFGLTVNADLVTLSACQSGLAKVNNGDDLVGLGRAFVYAGTHTLLSTLWRVDDVATAVAIKRFYRDYGKMDKAEALRRAQIQVRRTYAHPAYWAGLVLSGDWK